LNPKKVKRQVDKNGGRTNGKISGDGKVGGKAQVCGGRNGLKRVSPLGSSDQDLRNLGWYRWGELGGGWGGVWL